LTNIASYINTTMDAAYGTATNYASGATGALVITSGSKGAGSYVYVFNNAVSQALDLTNSGQGIIFVPQAGAAAKQLSVSIDGKAAVAVDFSTDANAGASESLAHVATFINSALTADGTYGASYGSAVSGSTGALTITSVGTGSASTVSVNDTAANGNNTAAQALGLTTSGSASPDTVTGKDETLAQVVSFLNTTAQQALGTSTAANVFTLNSNNTIGIASQTKGATSVIALTAGSGNTSSTTSIETALGITNVPGALGTAGAGPSLTSIVNSLNQDFSANTTLQEAGLQASTSNGGTTLTVTSANQTNFRLDEYGTAGTNLGFGMTSGPFTGLVSGTSNASVIDAGGASVIGTSAGISPSSPAIAFSALQFGSDAQGITIAANSASGVSQSPLTLTLRNDNTAQTGATIDSAVSYINSQLQQSNNSTLQSIVAVKENVDGTEQINFLSALPSFSVSVGSSPNTNGLNGGIAQTFNSVANGAAANASIDTLQGAQSAVTAVTAAVAQLGTAQAAIGKGENQLTYAINLAQSQITNISAAESQIRDANVAEEAANLTKAQVLQQATVAAMAQANQAPQAVLHLLQ
jgi:flagellin